MSILMLLLFLGVPALLSWPLGWYMAVVLDRNGAGGGGALSTLVLKSGGEFLSREQDWKGYLVSMLLFNVVMSVAASLILGLQQLLPLNPDGKGALDPSLIFHTVASFVTNTNQQHYSGEVTMSYFSQMFALTWLQFVSAGTGIACLAALARALAGRTMLGNFYRDLSGSVIFILLPLSIMLALSLVMGGVPMTFDGAVAVRTLEGATQTIARGPVAAMEAIKQLGTNGGGYFGPNSAHPFENPTFLTNYLECISIPLIAMASVWMFGRITGRMRHAAVIFVVMLSLLVVKAGLAVWLECAPSASLQGLPVVTAPNLEGKELRFGPDAVGPVWVALTTATSNGSVNCMHDSLNPLTGLVPLVGMWLNVVFGGVGVGLINMFIYIIIGVFICGMMVGRTPEYCAKKVETHEMKLALLALLVHPLLILAGTALFAATPWGAATVLNKGAHGFSEILYEFSSAAANNGSGFEGLGDGTVPWNVACGLVMLLGRFIPIILPIAIAGSMAAKKAVPETTGTLRIDTPLFAVVILGSVVLIGALLFMPVAVLGPVADYLSISHH